MYSIEGKLFVLFFMLGLASALFTDANFPSDVPIGVDYGFDIKYNDTSAEKCYFTAYDQAGNILRYDSPISKKCLPDNVCTPSVLYIDEDGYVKHNFNIDSNLFMTDSTYQFVLDCADESYNATVTTRESDVPYWIANFEIYAIENFETNPTLWTIVFFVSFAVFSIINIYLFKVMRKLF